MMLFDKKKLPATANVEQVRVTRLPPEETHLPGFVDACDGRSAVQRASLPRASRRKPSWRRWCLSSMTDPSGEHSLRSNLSTALPLVLIPINARSAVDKVRIIALYIMHRDGVPEGDKKRLYQHARLALHEMDAIDNLGYLGVNVNKVGWLASQVIRLA